MLLINAAVVVAMTMWAGYMEDDREVPVEVFEAAVRHYLPSDGKDLCGKPLEEIYLSVSGTDPSDKLMARLKKIRPKIRMQSDLLQRPPDAAVFVIDIAREGKEENGTFHLQGDINNIGSGSLYSELWMTKGKSGWEISKEDRKQELRHCNLSPLETMRSLAEKTKDADLEGYGFACLYQLQQLTKIGQPAKKEVATWFFDKKAPRNMRILLGHEFLTKFANADDIPQLKTVVHDSDEPLRIKSVAVQILGSIGGEQALETIISATGEAKDRGMQIEILRAFGRIGDKEPLTYILQQFQGNDDSVRLAAAQALHFIAKKNNDSSIESPLQDLLNDKNFRYRESLARMLDRPLPKKNE